MSSRSRVASVRHGAQKRYHPLITISKFLMSSLAVVVSATLITGGILVYSVNDSIQSNAVELETKPETEDREVPQMGALEGGANILLVGSDSGEGDQRWGNRTAALNDVNILIHINESHDGITAVSFPRDTFVDIPECTNSETGKTRSGSRSVKINEALSRGGLSCVVKTVENLTGISIPYAAMVEFNGVIEMSNAVGGVNVCVNAAINDSYTGVHLEPGEYSLQGNDALAFLRTRHGVGDGSDLGRISNQQLFLSALVREIKSDNTLNDFTKLYALARATADNVKLSTSLANLNTLVAMALTLKDIELEEVNFIQYPTVYGNSGSQSGVFPNTSAANALMNAIKNEQKIVLSGGTAPGNIGSIITNPGTQTTDPEAVVLPPAVTGQNASQVTCSNGN